MIVTTKQNTYDPLCRLADIEDPGSIALAGKIDGEQKHIMVVRSGSKITAYVNACPHVGTPLDFVPGQLLDRAFEFVGGGGTEHQDGGGRPHNHR